MDQRIRELQRLAHEGDPKAAERMERELGRIGRHALIYREQANKDADPIESIQNDFDRTLIRKKMGKGWLTTEKLWYAPHHMHFKGWSSKGFFLLEAGLYITVHKFKLSKATWEWKRPNNSKRKTLRTHRDGRSRR